MKSLIRNTISIAAAVALGLSGCTQSGSEAEYKNVSQDSAVTRSADEGDLSQEREDSFPSNQDIGGTLSQTQSVQDIYQTLDAVVEDHNSGLAYSEDGSTLFLKYDPEMSILYLKMAPTTDASLHLDPFLYGLTEYDTLNNPQIVRSPDNPSLLNLSSTDEARAILEIMPEVYAPSLYQESAFNPDIIRFGYDGDQLDQYIQETDRYPINNRQIRQRAIDIMRELSDEAQENPYHVLDAVQDWVTETDGSTQSYVTLARAYGIPTREVDAYTVSDGPQSLAMVYLEPYGWMLTDPQNDDTIREFLSDDTSYYFRIGTALQEKGVSVYPINADDRHELIDPLLEDIMLYRHQEE